MTIDIIPVNTEDDLVSVLDLFKAYAQWLDIDLSFQNFDSELSNLPGSYAPPDGTLLLAKDIEGRAIGCVALRPLVKGKICEIKRLYVVPDARGSGAGKILAKTIIDMAMQIGYEKIRLDTLSHMTSAISLYKQLGFQEIDCYYQTPLPDTIFLEKDLKTTR